MVKALTVLAWPPPANVVLARAGWDVENDGLIGAPPLRILCGEHVHATVYTALRLLGLGPTRLFASSPTTGAG